MTSKVARGVAYSCRLCAFLDELGCRPLRGLKHARGMHDRDRRVCAHCVKCKALSLHFDGVCDEDC